jgi:hypothetical protein
MEQMIKLIAQNLVDQPDDVRVNRVESSNVTMLELSVAKSDIGKIIGKQGRTAQALRTILNAVSTKGKKRAFLEIIE